MDKLSTTLASSFQTEYSSITNQIRNRDDDIVIEINIPTAEELSQRATIFTNTARDLGTGFFSKISSIVQDNIQIIPGGQTSVKKKADLPKSFDRRTAAIAGIRNDTATYFEDPTKSTDFGVVERFGKFSEKWDVEEASFKIARVVGDDPVVESILKQVGTKFGCLISIVPGQVLYSAFWARYFFRVEEFDLIAEGRRRIFMMQKDEEGKEDVSWDSSSDEGDGEVVGQESTAVKGPLVATDVVSQPEMSEEESPLPQSDTVESPFPTPLETPVAEPTQPSQIVEIQHSIPDKPVEIQQTLAESKTQESSIVSNPSPESDLQRVQSSLDFEIVDKTPSMDTDSLRGNDSDIGKSQLNQVENKEEVEDGWGDDGWGGDD
jgi:hypothetical protein